MVEEGEEDKKEEESKEIGEESKQKISPVRRISLAFSDIYGLVKKPKKMSVASPKGDKEQPSSQPGKSAVALPSVLNVQKINLKTVNQVLIFVLVGLVMAMFYVTFREGPSITSVMGAVSKIKFMEFESKEIVAFQKITGYLDQIKTRDIFRIYQEEKPPAPVQEVKEEAPPPPPPKPKVPIEQKAKNFKLMGISWGSNPKAMIRNTSTQEVLFMSEGEKIKDTELTIEKVMKEEVIISSEGEEMSLL